MNSCLKELKRSMPTVCMLGTDFGGGGTFSPSSPPPFGAPLQYTIGYAKTLESAMYALEQLKPPSINLLVKDNHQLPCITKSTTIPPSTVSLLYDLAGGSACRRGPCDFHCIYPLISL